MAEQEKRTDPVTHTDSAAKIDTSVDMQLESLRKWLRDTQIALIALAESIDDNCPAINGPGYPKVVRERLGCVGPIPPPPQPEAKPEGLKWGCKLLPSKTGMSGKGVYSPSGKYYLYGLSPSHAWAVGDKDETYTHFPSDAAALAALNACTTPPPDFVEPAKPEAGEQRVEGNEEWRTMLDFAPGLNKRMRVRSYCGQHELCTDGVDTPSWTTAMNGGSFTPYELSRVWLQMPPPPGVCTKYQASPSLTTPQPAEPKVMPQPSEQAKGAEPSDMAKRLTNKLWLNHLGMDVIRNYALEIDAAFAAEMESVKKGASR